MVVVAAGKVVVAVAAMMVVAIFVMAVFSLKARLILTLSRGPGLHVHSPENRVEAAESLITAHKEARGTTKLLEDAGKLNRNVASTDNSHLLRLLLEEEEAVRVWIRRFEGGAKSCEEA